LPDSGRRRGGGSRTGPASAKESQVGSR
jgi:hypothetical protein